MLDDLQERVAHLRFRADFLAGQIEGHTEQSRIACRRYKRCRRLARRCMRRARGLQSQAMCGARTMAGLRTELASLQKAHRAAGECERERSRQGGREPQGRHRGRPGRRRGMGNRQRGCMNPPSDVVVTLGGGL